MTAVLVIEAVVILLLGVLVAGLLRSHAEIMRALRQLGAPIGDPADGPPPVGRAAAARTGAAAADVTGSTPWDEAVAVSVTGVGHDTLLAFLSSGCTTCARFWAGLAEPEVEAPGGARLVVVTRGPEHESPARLAELAPRELPVVLSESAWADYGVPGAPYFVYVNGPSGRVVGEGTAASWPQVASLIGQATTDRGGRDDDTRSARELAAAGIGPGHASLYAEPPSRSPGG